MTTEIVKDMRDIRKVTDIQDRDVTLKTFSLDYDPGLPGGGNLYRYTLGVAVHVRIPRMVFQEVVDLNALRDIKDTDTEYTTADRRRQLMIRREREGKRSKFLLDVQACATTDTRQGIERGNRTYKRTKLLQERMMFLFFNKDSGVFEIPFATYQNRHLFYCSPRTKKLDTINNPWGHQRLEMIFDLFEQRRTNPISPSVDLGTRYIRDEDDTWCPEDAIEVTEDSHVEYSMNVDTFAGQVFVLSRATRRFIKPALDLFPQGKNPRALDKYDPVIFNGESFSLDSGREFFV